MNEPIHVHRPPARTVRVRVLSGMLLLVPLFVTLAVLRLVFNLFAAYVRPVLKIFQQRTAVPDSVVIIATVMVMILALYVLGWLAGHVFGRRLIGWGERILERIPLVKTVYSSTKTVVSMMSADNRQAFRCVVSVEFPRAGIRSIGFVTGAIEDTSGARYAKVFVPTTPNPTSGFLCMLPWADVHRLDMSIEDGLKMILSGGILSPSRLNIQQGRSLVAADLVMPPLPPPTPPIPGDPS